MDDDRDARSAWIERVLGVQLSPKSGSVDEAETVATVEGLRTGLVAYRRALLEFGSAKKRVAAEIGALADAIASTLPDEAELARDLSEHLADLNDQIGDSVDAAMSTAENDRAPANKRATDMMQSYLVELARNPLVKHVDANPFVPVQVAATLGGALRKIIACVA